MTAPLNGKKIFGAARFFGINNVTNPTPARFGLPQDSTVTFKRGTKAIFGEKQLAADVSAGELDVSGKVTYGESNPRIFADLLFGDTGATGQTLEADGELGTVPASSTYTIQVTNHTTWTQDLGVVDVVTGKRMKCVAAAAEVAGVSYSVAAGVYTFASGDASMAKKISYLYTNSSAGETVVLSNQLMGRVGGFTAVNVFNWTNAAGVLEQDVLTLTNCIASDAEIASKMGDYAKPTFGYAAACDQTDSLGTFSFAEAA